MADHTLDVHFKATSSCTNADISRDEWVIQKMALAVCAPETPPDAISPLVLCEAMRVYLMINAMRLALEEEVKASSAIEQVA